MGDLLERWRRRRPGWLGRTWARHPRLAMAVRAAVAAAIAWYVGLAMPDPLGDYPYYAPMGAVVATSFTLAGSVRESVQAVASIALGAVIALVIDSVGEPNVLGVALVVALGVLVAGWRVLGSMGSWVVTGALFTLVFGQTDPAGYVGAFAGLTAVGAAIGLGVTWVFPALPLAPAQEAVMRVRAMLVAQLRDLADGLDRDTPPDADEWAAHRRTLEPLIATMRTAVREAEEAGRGNRRARHYAEPLAHSVQQARSLDQAAFLVENLTEILISEERAENERVALGPELRPAAARALAALATALETVRHAQTSGAGDDGDDDYAAAADALEGLVAEMQRVRGHYPDDAFLPASAVASSIRRCLDALRPVVSQGTASSSSQAGRAVPDGIVPET
ncbi:FUSC family protein [Georgenia wangjunii]|uniref:FUSC family protein n=1 Tax=Georgenia wangjunii TaxID=3117730 RepID=UPI002F267CBE